MQPPPQAVPPSVVGPPPTGNPQSMLWSTSPYRRQVTANAPVAPVTRPSQPVTDPFAFSRQALQNTSLGSASKSSPPILPGPAPPMSLQRPGLPMPHANTGSSSQGPREPLLGPLWQPSADASAFSSVSTPAAPPGPEMNSSAEGASSSEREVQTQHIPGAGHERFHGGHLQRDPPGPDGPPSGQNLHDVAAAPAASPFFSQPRQQMPGHWGPGGPEPLGQHYWPSPEGSVQNMVPQATSVGHFRTPSNPHQGPGHEQHSPLASLPGPLGRDGRDETPCLQSGHHAGSNFDLENTFRQNFRVGSTRAGQELRPSPGMKIEQLPDPAPVNPPTQGNSPESHLQYPLGPGTGQALPGADSGVLSMFFQGGETENEENLASEKTGLAGQSDFDGVSLGPGLGHPPAYMGAGGVYQAFLSTSNSETTQRGGDTQPFFPQSAGIQHDQPATERAVVDVWGDTAGARTRDAGSSHYENAENSEFTQNQEVLPREPPSLDPSSPGDQLRYGPLPGPAVPRRSVVGHAGGEGPNIEALDAPLHPVRSDSVSSSYNGRSHRSHPGASRPQDLGTFIQQEVGKPEDEASGSFFKQIDSSPVGGEADEAPASPDYHGSLAQPSAPSPPKPTGIFQTSANSSFEPVKSHFVGVKPVEADRANMVGELRETRAHQRQPRPAAAPPDSCPGNLEQPPDNMETLCPARVCSPRLSTPTEAGHGLPHAGGAPLETVPLTPEKRPMTRAHGAAKCESPATTLWAQNELPDFGGNVLLAPAAPALHVPARPQSSEVIQPPDEGTADPLSRPPGFLPPLQSGDGMGASENLENPPQMGEEEALLSQASSGYASLLSSPPTESLQNQPVLAAQPDQSCSPAQPVNLSVSSSTPTEKARSHRDAWAGDRAVVSSRAVGGDSGETALSGLPASSQVSSPLPHSLTQSHRPQVTGTPEMASTQPANLLVHPPSHPAPKSLLLEAQKIHSAETALPELLTSPVGDTGVMLVLPANATSGPPGHKAELPSNREETPGALDSAAPRTSGTPVRTESSPHSDGPTSHQHPTPSQPRRPGPPNPDHFYQQVTTDAQDQRGLERAQQEPAPTPPQGPRAALPEPSHPRSPPAQGRPPDSAQLPASLAPADTSQQLLPRPPQSSSASAVSSSSSQAAVRSDQQWLPQPAPDLAPYYYHRSFYDGYQPQYPSPYLPDPGTTPLYYQDMYGLYEPRYRSYDSATPAYAENYRYPDPERPSSRASHCSDRPSARQAYPEGYYSKSGWSSQSDYYASYYPSQYEYGDPSHWDRHAYSSRLRDPRLYDRRYWYDAEYEPLGKEQYAYPDRPGKYDHWRYDPRFTGSFDDDHEPHRDTCGEDADRRSVHSEHSARSLHSAPSVQSRRSSFSTHSQQSQVYRSRNVTAGPYEVPPPPGSFHGDYAYDTYGSNFNSAPGFPEYGYPADGGWPAVEQVPSRPTSPEKFSVPHVCARFGPGGQLIKVVPNLPSEGQPALVEVHSMETLLQHMPEQDEMRSFPGPLGKDDTHKVDVINFAQNKATKCLQNENLIDKESASLLWNFIVLLCRQNGTVVGTDLAELLLRDHRTVWLPGKSPDEANLIDFTNEAVGRTDEEESGEAQLAFLTDTQATAVAGTLEKDTERFRELLLYGRKKDALESAMKSGLWGHALLLASKMDSRTHARVMTRFANSLPINDPLQTVYQLMSGRMPAASTCCGDEKWGDWRPHLAMVLSNLSNNMDVESRTMATMGDTLASRGLLDAAHFCYLMAQVGFGVYARKTTKLVLIGSNHSLPFLKFATNEAIQRTEAYEYAQSLGAQSGPLPNFQVFKFIYSCRLAEMGFATQAFHYCEVIAKSILLQPRTHSPVLVRQLVQLASQLRLFDPQLKEKPEEEAFVQPAWLSQLQHLERQVQEGAVPQSPDTAFAQRPACSLSPELGQCDGPGLTPPLGLGTDNPLLAPPVPATECSGQGLRLLPSAPLTLPDGPPAIPARVPMFPVQPPLGSVEPGPGCGSPGSALGFAEAPGPDPAALCPGPGLPPGTPSLQESGHWLPEARTQDPGPAPLGAPGGDSLAELRDENFGGKFDNMGSSRGPQDSEGLPGWGAASPGALQPPAMMPAPEGKGPVQAARRESKEPKKSGESWFSRWLTGKRKTEAYLPDDKNKSIVWDEKRNRWVDVNEPEEEKKAPPPPPISLPKVPQAAAPGPGGLPGSSVNMFSRKAAGSRARYVDVLNPGGRRQTEPALAPADFFAPLAPLPIPAHLCGPHPDAAAGAGGEGQAHAEPVPEPQELSSAAVPPASDLPPHRADGPQGGELSRCSSMSSLSREVSQHFDQAPGDHAAAEGPPGATVPFYDPAHFAQASATSGSSRTGRIGQRKYPALS